MNLISFILYVYFYLVRIYYLNETSEEESTERNMLMEKI